MYKGEIYISLKKSVFDPQGNTVMLALKNLGFNSFEKIRMGKYIEVFLNSQSKEEAEQQLKEACQKLLVNPTIEQYEYKIEEI